MGLPRLRPRKPQERDVGWAAASAKVLGHPNSRLTFGILALNEKATCCWHHSEELKSVTKSPFCRLAALLSNCRPTSSMSTR